MVRVVNTSLHIGGPCDGELVMHNPKARTALVQVDKRAEAWAVYYRSEISTMLTTYIFWTHRPMSAPRLIDKLIHGYLTGRELARLTATPDLHHTAPASGEDSNGITTDKRRDYCGG